MPSPIAQDVASTSVIDESRGRISSLPTSHPSSRPTSRSSSRVRDLLHTVTHLGAGTDWATQSFAHAHDPDAVGVPHTSRPASPSGREPRSASRTASPAGSRSGSRVRDILHKATHMGAGTDWATQSFSHAHDPEAVGVTHSSRPASPSGREPRSASRTASPAGSRSGSRVRDILHKATHMGAGTDWATQSFAHAHDSEAVGVHHPTPAVVEEPVVV